MQNTLPGIYCAHLQYEECFSSAIMSIQLLKTYVPFQIWVQFSSLFAIINKRLLDEIPDCKRLWKTTLQTFSPQSWNRSSWTATINCKQTDAQLSMSSMSNHFEKCLSVQSRLQTSSSAPLATFTSVSTTTKASPCTHTSTCQANSGSMVGRELPGFLRSKCRARSKCGARINYLWVDVIAHE